jgi:hypothetical protein
MTAHTPAEIIAKLGQLVPDEIARLFADENVVGELGKSRECPVARYVRRETGVTVSIDYESWRHGSEFPSYRKLLPESVEGFIDMFDRGQYPHLIESEES